MLDHWWATAKMLVFIFAGFLADNYDLTVDVNLVADVNHVLAYHVTVYHPTVAVTYVRHVGHVTVHHVSHVHVNHVSVNHVNVHLVTYVVRRFARRVVEGTEGGRSKIGGGVRGGGRGDGGGLG